MSTVNPEMGLAIAELVKYARLSGAQDAVIDVVIARLLEWQRCLHCPDETTNTVVSAGIADLLVFLHNKQCAHAQASPAP